MVFPTVTTASPQVPFPKTTSQIIRRPIRCGSASVSTQFDLKTYWTSLIKEIDQKLDEAIPVQYPQRIYEAMRYSVLAKGAKRSPPVMCVAACEIFGGNRQAAFPTACALEMENYVQDVDEGSSPLKTCMLKFKGRSDFCGSEDISVEQRKLLTEFLNREQLDVTIWMDEHICLTGPLFCGFLFGELVSGIIINVYMRIMQKKSMDYGFQTYCMDTLVQKEVLQDLVRYGKRRRISKTEYGNFIGRLTSATREKLHELNEDLFRRCKYIIFPINDRFHWYLLVFKASEGKFLLFNSLHDPFSVGTAKVMARFLSGCVSHISGFTIGSDDVLRQRCRQQGTTLDCGVYACLWIECLCCDTEEIWAYEQDVKMDTYRARVAATIISDGNGILKNTFV